MSIKMLLTVTAFLCLSSVSRGEDSITPVPRAQELLIEMSKAVSTRTPENIAEANKNDIKLRDEYFKAVGNDRTVALRQYIYYVQNLCHEDRASADNILFIRLLIFTAMKPSNEEMLTATLPYLGTKDTCLQQITFSYLARSERPTEKGPFYSKYVEVLRNSIAKHEEPSGGLMRYVYQRQHGAAVLEMTGIDADLAPIKKLLHVAHPEVSPVYRDVSWKGKELNFQSEWDVDALKAEFERLSKSPKW